MSDGSPSVDNELAIERVIDAPPAAVWRAFTSHLEEWWCPRPWTTDVVAIDWRAGGRFATVMRDPDGGRYPDEGVLLTVVPERLVVFTNLLTAGWRPQVPRPFGFVATFSLTDLGDSRTGYRASAAHASGDDAERHRAMQFEQGWGAAAAQLEEVARRLA